MALGLPIVAGRDSGAVPWVVGAVDGVAKCAILVDIESPEAMAQAMEAAFDPGYEERSRLGRQRACAEFSVQRIAECYLTEYRAAVAERACVIAHDEPVLMNQI